MSDLSDETRDLIARGRAGVPLSAKRRGAIRAGVLAKLAGAAVVATTTTSTKTAAAAGFGWSSAVLKVVGIAAVTTAMGAGAVAIMREDSRVNGPSARPAATGASVTSTPATPPAPAEPTPGTTVEAPTAETVPLAAPAASPVEPGVARRAWKRDGLAAASTDGGSVVGREPENDPSPQEPASSLEGDVLLLREAHRALTAGDGARALRLLDEHARRFPASALEPERSAESVFALCQLRRVDSARAAAAAFLSAHPEGPLAARVRGSCARQ